MSSCPKINGLSTLIFAVAVSFASCQNHVGNQGRFEGSSGANPSTGLHLDTSLLLDPRLKDLYQVIEEPSGAEKIALLPTYTKEMSPSQNFRLDSHKKRHAIHSPPAFEQKFVQVSNALDSVSSLETKDDVSERTDKILSNLEEIKEKLRELGQLLTSESGGHMRQAGALGISLDATSVLALLTMGAYLIRMVLTILHVSQRSLSAFSPVEIESVLPVISKHVPTSLVDWLLLPVSSDVSVTEKEGRSLPDVYKNATRRTGFWWGQLSKLPGELQTTWDLSKHQKPECLRRFICQRLAKVPPHKRQLGDDLVVWTMSGIAYYNGKPVNIFVDEIDNKLAANQEVNCEAFSEDCSEREYREGLQRGQLLSKLQGFLARWMTS